MARIGALIPIRLESERLPGKALLPILGRPVVHHLLDRMFQSRHLRPEDVIICTTTAPSDDALCREVEAAGAGIFRGSVDDIIDRFYRAVQSYDFDAVIQVDGDDPCTDTEYMDLCMDRLLEDPSLGIVLSQGLPLGVNSKAFRRSALETVWNAHITSRNDTGFIYYFTRTGLCTSATVRAKCPAHCLDEARLTLDYPEDLEFFRQLFGLLYEEGKVFGIGEIVETLRRRPDLIAINAHVTGGYWERTRRLAELEYSEDGVVRKVPV